MARKISEEIEKKVCTDYLTDKYSSRELGIKYSLSKSTILRILQRNNITPVNHRLVNNQLIVNYFERIDCEEKAYLLGFIFADGCVNNGQLWIDINDKDREILEKIRDLLHSGCKISTRVKGKSIMSRITIKNANFVSYLEQYGIIKNKTKETRHLPIDRIPQIFQKDFLRGLIDGDGWLTKDAQNNWHIGYVTQYITTAEDFVTMINNFLQSQWHNRIINRNNKYAVVQIQSKIQVEQLAHALYADNKICLSRKFKLAQEIYDSKC